MLAVSTGPWRASLPYQPTAGGSLWAGKPRLCRVGAAGALGGFLPAPVGPCAANCRELAGQGPGAADRGAASPRLRRVGPPTRGTGLHGSSGKRNASGMQRGSSAPAHHSGGTVAPPARHSTGVGQGSVCPACAWQGWTCVCVYVCIRAVPHACMCVQQAVHTHACAGRLCPWGICLSISTPWHWVSGCPCGHSCPTPRRSCGSRDGHPTLQRSRLSLNPPSAPGACGPWCPRGV